MTDSSRVMALLQDGNPAPDLPDEAWSEVSAAAYLAALKEGAAATPDEETRRYKRESPDIRFIRSPLNRRLSIAWGRAVVFMALLVGIGSMLLPDRDPPIPVAGPVEIAVSFMNALNDHDVDAMLAMSGPDMVSSDNTPDGTNGTVEGFRAQFAQEEVLGWTRHFTCEVATTTPVRTLVRCPYSFSNHITDVYGLDPYPGNYAFLWVEDGVVTVFDLEEDDDDWHGEGGGLGMFVAWLSASYPDTTGIDFHYWYTDQANFEFWQEYIPLFLASEGSVDLSPMEIATRVMDALNAHDPMVLLALSSLDVISPNSADGTFEGFEAEIEQEGALGWTYHYTCDIASSTEAGTSIECPYSFSNHITEAFGLDPYQGSQVRMRVVDAEIVDFVIDEASDAWQREGGGLDLFYQWLVENYPDEDRAETFEYHYTDEENLDFWKQYIPLLLASEADSG